MDVDRLDPTPEQRRAMDATGIARELAELRALPRAALCVVSTRLTMVSATLAQAAQRQESAVLLHTARLLYLLGNETPAAAVTECPQCGHPDANHSTLVSSDAARHRCNLCDCVRVEP
jgi:hypothetical protein